MWRCLSSLPLRASLVALPFLATPAVAAAPDETYMRSDRYPAQVTAIDFANRR